MICGHLVMARFLSGSVPGGYRVDEGSSWCQAVIARFKKYEERSGAVGVSELEQGSLTALMGGHMLKMNPKERVWARGFLEEGLLVAAAHTAIALKLVIDEQDGCRTNLTPGQRIAE